MSLRIIIQPDQIRHWIAERRGRPARKRGTDTELRILFDRDDADYEPITVDELLEAMRFHHFVLLVDQEPGKTFHKFIRHG
jgi:hypothetical protein